jgi:hypothetical protein
MVKRSKDYLNGFKHGSERSYVSIFATKNKPTDEYNATDSAIKGYSKMLLFGMILLILTFIILCCVIFYIHNQSYPDLEGGIM